MKLRHSLIALGMLLASVALAAPLKYDVFVKDAKIGSYEIETTGDDETGYTDETTFTVKQDTHTLVVNEVVHYDKDGLVTSKTMTITADGKESKAKAKLSDDGAKVSLTIADSTDDREVALATKTTRVDPTNFWFKKGAPESGTKVTYQSFDMQELEWHDVTFLYKGKNKVTVAGKEFEGHEIERTEGDEKSVVVLDDKGDVIVFSEGDTRFVRI